MTHDTIHIVWDEHFLKVSAPKTLTYLKPTHLPTYLPTFVTVITVVTIVTVVTVVTVVTIVTVVCSDKNHTTSPHKKSRHPFNMVKITIIQLQKDYLGKSKE